MQLCVYSHIRSASLSLMEEPEADGSERRGRNWNRQNTSRVRRAPFKKQTKEKARFVFPKFFLRCGSAVC